ncbi:MAG TPA: flagellar motor protein MotB, partial [Acidimicrobiales bacterium]|nr:flagellar motor protein MotB [Acidimicrobiales bacterium]
MSRPHKRGSEAHGEEGPSNERWLLTYSDMITLLMVLFIVLFALGQTDIRKFNAFKDSFHWLTQTQDETPPGGPGVLSQPSAIALTEQNPFARLTVSNANASSGEQTIGQLASGNQAQGQSDAGQQSKGTTSAGRQTQGQNKAGQQAAGHANSAANKALAKALNGPNESTDLANAEKAMEAALQKLGLANDVYFTRDARGLVVSILTDKILFNTDSAQLQPEGVVIINAIAPVLALLPNEVDIEGDTDNVPIHGGPYQNNWALSAMRAVAVVDDLIDYHGIDPDRLQ